MSPYVPLALAWAAGVALGLFYFGGLWLTVRQLATRNRPVPLFLGSFLVRTVAVVAGFYFVMGGRWERVLACLAGFVMARLLLTTWLRSARRTGSRSRQDEM